jgi:hypothetical protein
MGGAAPIKILKPYNSKMKNIKCPKNQKPIDKNSKTNEK